MELLIDFYEYTLANKKESAKIFTMYLVLCLVAVNLLLYYNEQWLIVKVFFAKGFFFSFFIACACAMSHFHDEVRKR